MRIFSLLMLVFSLGLAGLSMGCGSGKLAQKADAGGKSAAASELTTALSWIAKEGAMNSSAEGIPDLITKIAAAEPAVGEQLTADFKELTQPGLPADQIRAVSERMMGRLK